MLRAHRSVMLQCKMPLPGNSANRLQLMGNFSKCFVPEACKVRTG